MEQVKRKALLVKESSHSLSSLSFQERKKILDTIADDLLLQKDLILQENQKDVEEAKKNKIAEELIRRLSLSSSKLHTLSKGIRAIGEQEDPIGRVVQQTEIANGLLLKKMTVPIGVLLVIFESRPDSLPQICALCLKTGNGLLLKGGKEAMRSNKILHKIVVDGVAKATNNTVSRDVITLFSDRTDIKYLLEMNEIVDLVIPRGSGKMVSNIQENTKIPVLGHSEGVCHLYLDSFADVEKASRIALDAKTDYPAACNAIETLLIHETLCLKKDKKVAPAVEILNFLRSGGVSLLSGPRVKQALSQEFSFDGEVDSFRSEYSEKILSVEVVKNMDEAIKHIHKYGSSHTEVIVTEKRDTAKTFLSRVDSACVFWNASSRFADGYRFGLGAEVGISTYRIHARGPVGTDGLLSTKW
eukprot:CAMPEP_0201485200 /NCGR_PEP_ID=MMETSP0151_2-20130828/9326_1 /ASSEMBLY_ACC=CAM_ASM_000257 /TAXON_ID=200890 /ORGANISM="Paramoeba atlantica, Strain 621/1 / CCAP 1560/9" /LENGTH=414 /DNA_ID=CAMNT_0047869221 /DNA_START=49 /DNA_END=1290 /DNA_ORIENTATION=-